jgi:hypothetical protein
MSREISIVLTQMEEDIFRILTVSNLRVVMNFSAIYIYIYIYI